MKNQTPKVSIVIPAYNEEQYLGETLESLANQKTEINFEVIIVDNNSTDKTAKIAESFQNKLNLRVVLEKRQSRGAARARGFQEAQAPIIVSTDADCTVYPDWVDTLTKAIGDQVVAVTTSAKIEDCSFLTRILFNIIQPVITVAYRLMFGHYWLAGFSFAILKSIYQQSGGFDPNLQALEDTDLAFKVSKLGKIKFIPKPVTFSGRRFKIGLIHGLYQYARTFIQGYLLKREKVYMSNVR